MSSQPPPGSVSGGPTHEQLVMQKQGQAVMIWAIGSFCIFGWEWLLCLPQEYKRIWKRPMNTSSVLYLLNRYFGILQFSFVVTLNANAWGPSACKNVFLWEPVGALISTVLSQFILGTRVYAIFRQSKIVGAVLVVTLIVEIVIGGLAIGKADPPPIVTGGPPGSQPPCNAVQIAQGWLVTFWTIPLFYDTLAFAFTAWKAYDFWKQEVNTPLFDIIWRDGLLYFFAVFSMNLTNVVIILTAPQILRAVNLSPTLVFEVVLSCRLLLNIREVHGRTTAKPLWTPSQSKVSNNTRSRGQPSQVESVVNIGSRAQAEPTELKPLDHSVVRLEPNRRTEDSGSESVDPIEVKVNKTWSAV